MRKCFLGLFLLLNACNPKDPLFGHWHLYYPGSNRLIGTIDLLEHDVVVFNRYSFYGPQRSYWDRSAKYIPGGRECGLLNMTYQLRNDTLYIEQTSLGSQLVATKCEGRCCDRQAEFFNLLDMEIDLPVLDSNYNGIIEYERHLFDQSISLGDTRFLGYNGYNSGKRRLKIGGKFATTRDFPFMEELSRIRFGQDGSKRMRYLLFIDQFTAYYQVNEVLTALQENGLDQVYLAGRTAKVKGDDFRIFLFPFSLDHQSTVDDHLEYGQWIRMLLDGSLTTTIPFSLKNAKNVSYSLE
ncbi:MAG: hypothetical protein R2824_12595 [Saprospiraceae bacterium]|nr:hypothetical protein [Lewinella sp.]